MAERRPLKTMRHALEYALVRGLLALFGALPLDRSSALGGWMGRLIGPRLALSERARMNLRHAFPDFGGDAIDRIVRGMWDNIGRVVAEYPHLGAMRFAPEGRIELVGGEIVARCREQGTNAIYISGHLANWELAPVGAGLIGLDAVQVFRAANNPWVDGLLEAARAPTGGTRVPKGRAGARAVLKALGQKRNVCMLVDQKLNEGLAIPFFGRPAMTPTAPAAMALRFKVPLIPVRLERLGGAHFRMTVLPPMVLPESENNDEAVRETLTDINALLESWIRDRPEQWLWLHRRWPKEDATPSA